MSEGVRYHTGKFPPQDLDWEQLVPLIARAHRNIAKFDGLLQAVPNPEVLLNPLRTKEATSSCRIEGTQVTDGDVFAADAAAGKSEVDEKKRHEILEAQNYRRAIKRAVELIDEPSRPRQITVTIVKETHRLLMDGLQQGNPGRFRKDKVHIGIQGGPALFHPIEYYKVEEGMAAWAKYTADSGGVKDQLVQLAVSHVEYESIHPFFDGNGRMGRLLVPLFLYKSELLSAPTFYVSEYLEEHRKEYYERLRKVSSKDDWTGWCKYFLEALTEQGRRNVEKAKGILDLYAEKKEIMRMDKAPGDDPTRALDFFFEKVEFNSKAFREESGMADATANRLIKYCVEKEWLECTKEAKGRRPATYSFTKLRELIE